MEVFIMLVDLILLLVIAVAVFIGWKRGLVMSIFLLGTTIVAIIKVLNLNFEKLIDIKKEDH